MPAQRNFGEWDHGNNLGAWSPEVVDTLASEIIQGDIDLVQAVRNQETEELNVACQGMRNQVRRLRLDYSQERQDELVTTDGYVRYGVVPVPNFPMLLRLVVNVNEDEPGNVLRKQIRSTDYVMYLPNMTITRQTGVIPNNLVDAGDDRDTTGLPPLILRTAVGLRTLLNSEYQTLYPMASIVDETPLAVIQQQRHAFQELAQVLARFPVAD